LPTTDALGDTKGPDLSPVPEDPGKVPPELAVIGRSITGLLPVELKGRGGPDGSLLNIIKKGVLPRADRNFYTPIKRGFAPRPDRRKRSPVPLTPLIYGVFAPTQGARARACATSHR
jgi:hypothetical protein